MTTKRTAKPDPLYRPRADFDRFTYYEGPIGVDKDGRGEDTSSSPVPRQKREGEGSAAHRDQDTNP